MSLKNLNDKVIKTREDVDMKIGDKAASLRECAIEALLAIYPEEKLIGVESAKRYDLYKKIDVSGDVDLTSEEITLIKTLVGKCYPPLVVGQFYKMIEE